jgi:hypothetical protein
MYTPEEIRRLFGEEVLSYLRNKNTGGVNNERGNTYENFFAAYQLALLAQEVIEADKEIQFFSQILAFVDDLIIDCQDESPLRHYQLRNSSNVVWESGSRPLADDFQKQYNLNQAMFRDSQLHLVVADQALQTKLDRILPAAIQAFSQTLYFPYDPNLTKVIAKQPEFQRAIGYLCAFENPEPDKIECVATVLLGAWVASDKSGISVMQVLKKAQTIQPSYIRSFAREWSLDPEVTAILDCVPGFDYNLSKGFLHWKYQGGLDQGTLPYSIDTETFRRFQGLIQREQPMSFEELEVFLI